MFYDKFYIPNREGQRLACIQFLPPEKTEFQMIVAHGFRGRKENSGRIEVFAQKLTALGGSVLAFDFAGSGESEGLFSQMTLSRQIADLQAVIDHRTFWDPAPLVVLGRSFGGTTSLAACAGDPRIKGLVLWSAPVFLTQTFFRVMPHESDKIPTGSLELEDEQGCFTLGPEFARDLLRHDCGQYLERLHDCPLLVIHGADDQDVDPVNAQFFQRAGRDLIEVRIVPGADHRFAEKQSEREEITLNWLGRYLLGRSQE